MKYQSHSLFQKHAHDTFLPPPFSFLPYKKCVCFLKNRGESCNSGRNMV